VPRLSPSTLPRPIHSRVSRGQSTRVAIPVLPDDNPVKAQLDRILKSNVFAGALRSQLFLRYIVDQALDRPDEPLKEYSIALDVFDRDAYDPAVDATVRVEAGRLRSRLLEYYAGEGQADLLLIEVPKGSYRVLIRERQPVEPPPPAFPEAEPLQDAVPEKPSHLWAVPLAFLLGAFVGYCASL
jgi:hypothetical protein